MISSGHTSCKRLVAGNYDVLINEPPMTSASFKAVLTSYLNHFERQEADLSRYYKQLQLATLENNISNNNCVDLPIVTSCGYINEFKMLKELSKSLKENKSNFIDGELSENHRKNRYKDILPFSHTRVILSCNSQQSPPIGKCCGGDASKVFEPDRQFLPTNQNTEPASYINANYIRGPSGLTRAYIACQGPLACTLDDFWRMIWECNVSVIVMACNENESGKPKCELYWPDQLEASQIYQDVQVTLMRVRQMNSDFLIRKFSVKLLEPLAAVTSLGSHNQHQNISINCNSSNQQKAHCHVVMDTNNMDSNNKNNNNSCNQSTGTNEDMLYYDCDSNSFKLAGVRLPTAPGAPFYPVHSSDQDNSASATPNLKTTRTNGYCLSNGNNSTSNESISTSDDSTSLQTSSSSTTTSASINGSGQPPPKQSNRQILAERTICQFHYTTWPDHGVPNSVQPILELVRLVREVQPAENKPILVHCSAGCGRTGTICCIDYVWGLLRLGKLEASFNLCNIIREMRQQRMSMVQTLEQYILCHRAVAALFMQQLQLLTLDEHRRLSHSPATTASTNDRSSSSIEDKVEDKEDYNDNNNDVDDNYSKNNNDGNVDDDDDDDDDEIIDYEQDEQEDELGPVFI